MTRYVFEEVSYTAWKSVQCAGCGKKVKRQRTFTNTINPFNVNADGTPRTYHQIRDHLVNDLAASWQAEPEDCTACLRLRTRVSHH